MAPLIWPPKDPDDVRSYGIDVSAEVDEGDAISTVTWIIPAGLTKVMEFRTGMICKVRLAGGLPRHIYVVTVRVTFTSGDSIDRSVRLTVRDR